MAYHAVDPLAQNYTTALDRWLQNQRTAQNQFNRAADPLNEAVNLFRVGGGYGAGQNAILEDQARRAKAEALLNQVNSGISSGSLATSTGLRIGSDLAKAKLGVEDSRTQFLNQALQALSGLRTQQAGVTASTAADPYFNTFISNQTQQRGQNLGAQSAAASLAAQVAAQNVAQQQAAKQLALQQEQLNFQKQQAQQKNNPPAGAYSAALVY